MADCRINQPATPRHMSLQERLDRYSIPEALTGCYLYWGPTGGGGYGRLHFKNVCTGAHRWAWIAAKGPVPDGMQVCHRCDNRRCVNPDHLFVGTHQDNMTDKARKGRARNNPPRGEACKTATLNNALVYAIRRARGSQTAIARMFGVNQSTVSRVLTRKHWKEVA